MVGFMNFDRLNFASYLLSLPQKFMYKNIFRPILFLFSPECIHHLIIYGFKILSFLPPLERMMNRIFSIKDPRLKRIFCGLEFANPVGMAAGFDKNAEVYHQVTTFGFSFVEIGTVTPKAQPGNSKPRLFRLVKDKALINRMGFNNLGAENAANNLSHRKKGSIVGGNIGKNTLTPAATAKEDYINSFLTLYNVVDYIAVNISCPNIANMCELQKKETILDILLALTTLRKKQSIYKPILLKISPDLNDDALNEVIEIFTESKIDGIIATNTTTSRNQLVTSKEQIEKIGNGGLSGTPLKDRSTEIIKFLHDKSEGKIPIMAVGGIMSPMDALEKIHAGATLVQVYTGFIYNGPFFVKNINKQFLKEAFA
jgi:dihydroorotate dehydrogenase